MRAAAFAQTHPCRSPLCGASDAAPGAAPSLPRRFLLFFQVYPCLSSSPPQSSQTSGPGARHAASFLPESARPISSRLPSEFSPPHARLGPALPCRPPHRSCRLLLSFFIPFLFQLQSAAIRDEPSHLASRISTWTWHPAWCATSSMANMYLLATMGCRVRRDCCHQRACINGLGLRQWH